jgi:hypothetical protein
VQVLLLDQQAQDQEQHNGNYHTGDRDERDELDSLVERPANVFSNLLERLSMASIRARIVPSPVMMADESELSRLLIATTRSHASFPE